jgi:RNA ligase
MMKLHSYPKVYNLGHPAIDALFNGAVVVQEKIDGSQFSFGLVEGELCCRSKGADVHAETRDANFRAAVDTAIGLCNAGILAPGLVYRGEAVARPKHNTLEYERIPSGGLILFDVDMGLERRSDPEELAREADRVGLEYVPTFFHGVIADIDSLRSLLEGESVLGGKREGIVIKNYGQWSDKDGKMLMGKIVSDEFKETHKKQWGKRNPNRVDFVESLISEYTTDRRWEKAVERMRDIGLLEHSPRDIGKLMNEVPDDIKAECEHEIRDALFRHFWPQIRRGVTRGFPQWYKSRLEDSQKFGPNKSKVEP